MTVKYASTTLPSRYLESFTLDDNMKAEYFLV
jgi:hypothetical protein